jgi:DNA-binding response OmpR family regulator
MESEQLEQDTETLIHTHKSMCPFGTVENPALILIEPRQPIQSVIAVLLQKSNFGFITAHRASDIYLMSGSTHIVCVVLTDELGRNDLQTSAEAVRWQWRGTPIVILGRSAELEKHLFDECLPHCLDATVLITKLQIIAGRAHKQRVKDRRQESRTRAE